MKKMIAMAAVAMTMMMMASCSGDDSSTTNEPEEFGPLPKQINYTSGNGDEYSVTYSYDGNKITGYTATGGYDVDYTYSNGLLSKIETYLNNELIEQITFMYDNDNKLEARVKMNPDGEGMWAFKTVFTYNDDNTISLTYFTGDAEEQTEPSASSLLTVENGNTTSITHYEIDGTENYTEIFTFDDKHSPFKNVYANDVLLLNDLRGGANNILTSVIDTFPNAINYSEYTYNSDNMPVTRTETHNGTADSETEYIYE